jgi:hypothetical protein
MLVIDPKNLAFRISNYRCNRADLEAPGTVALGTYEGYEGCTLVKRRNLYARVSGAKRTRLFE